jgi:protein AbiQ
MLKFTSSFIYTVDPAYLEYLHQADCEVYYSPACKNGRKPFVGMLVGIENYHYFTPLTSARKKHARWPNVSKEYFLVYEKVPAGRLFPADVLKPFSSEENLHILSVLDLRKMIPVPEGFCRQIDFKSQDSKYRKLLEKEFEFCSGVQASVLRRAEELYLEQKHTGMVYKTHCNFSLLEQTMDEWMQKQSQSENRN